LEKYGQGMTSLVLLIVAGFDRRVLEQQEEEERLREQRRERKKEKRVRGMLYAHWRLDGSWRTHIGI
jgi:hypothetical protein